MLLPDVLPEPVELPDVLHDRRLLFLLPDLRLPFIVPDPEVLPPDWVLTLLPVPEVPVEPVPTVEPLLRPDVVDVPP